MQQMTLAQLRDWVASMSGTAEVLAVRCPGGVDVGTDIPNVPSDQTTGSYSGDEQRWARIVTNDGEDPDTAGNVEVMVKDLSNGAISGWMAPEIVGVWLAGAEQGQG